MCRPSVSPHIAGPIVSARGPTTIARSSGQNWSRFLGLEMKFGRNNHECAEACIALLHPACIRQATNQPTGRHPHGASPAAPPPSTNPYTNDTMRTVCLSASWDMTRR
ncbi:MAG: hypothetical protein M1823_002228 [Watsoniomyces obsoletus]|nr:MAG: hypothetical protein M1823_002228 [Watsoniomyces obsoletus]